MSEEYEKAEHVLSILKQAELAEAQTALPILNGLVGLISTSSRDQPLEVEELRANAFLAVCEIGKALHRGQPVGSLWAIAISATERWKSVAK